MDPFIILALGVGILILIYAGLYNGLVRNRNKVKEGWAGIDVQLKRRYDLIPNLIEVAKGYAKHERETLEAVTNARAGAIAVPNGAALQQAGAENMLTGTLKSLFALSESYPDLKADRNFLKIQEELAEAEDQIGAARRIYNGNVNIYNTKIQSFPTNMIAGLHHFDLVEFFEMSPTEREAAYDAPTVKF